MRVLGFCLSVLVLVLILVVPGLAQEPVPTPDPQAVLNRAEEVAALAEVTAQQNARTIELVRNLAWFFGILIGITAVALGLYGFNTQRGFQESMRDYRTQLNQMQAAYQAATERYQAEQANVQKLAAEMTEEVQEIKTIREALNGLRQSVPEEFAAAKQAVVLLSFGNRLFEDGKVRFAVDAYEEARRLMQDDPEIEYRLGRAYSEREEWDKAIKALKRAIGIKPDHAEAHAALGLAHRRLGEDMPAEERGVQYGLAIQYLQRAIELRPRDDHDYSDALSTLGGIYRRQGRYHKALHYYQISVPYDDTTYALNNVASLAWVLNEGDLARASFRRVEDIATEEIAAGRERHWRLYDRSLARLVLEKREEALADHREAIALTPAVSNYRSVLNNLYFLQQADTAIDGLDEFIRLVEERLPQD